MRPLNRKVLIDMMIRHETLTIDDLAKPVNLGFTPDPGQLNYLLSRLTQSGFLAILAGARPCTYTITSAGILEGARLGA